MKTIRALLVLPVVLLTLCSCGLFYASPFPLTLAQTMAQRDFSAEIDTSMEDRFQPYVIENGATRIILLVGGYPYSTDAAGKPWLFALREDLSLIDSSNLFELESMTGGSFSGSGAVIDCSGFLVVGNLRFTFTVDTITPVGVTGDVGNRGGVGDRAFQAGPGMANIAQVGTSGKNLNWNSYDCTWNLVSGPFVQIRTAGPDLYLRAVLAEPYPATGDVVLVLEENLSDPSTSYFVRVPRVDFSGGLDPFFLDLPFDNYPTFTKTNIEPRSLGITEDGIVAYSYETQEYMLFTFAAPDKPTTLRVGNLEGDQKDQRASWSWSGGYSCVYDPRTRTLSKVAQWWN